MKCTSSASLFSSIKAHVLLVQPTQVISPECVHKSQHHCQTAGSKPFFFFLTTWKLKNRNCLVQGQARLKGEGPPQQRREEGVQVNIHPPSPLRHSPSDALFMKLGRTKI